MKATSKNSQKGSITLEAAIVLPVLLCAFFSVIFLIKAVYTYELVQHALDETAEEMASAGYVYHISGIRDLHDTVRDGLSDNSEVFKNQIGTVFDTYDSLKSIGDNLEEGIGGLADSAGLITNAGEGFENMLDQADAVVSDPLNELRSIACYIAAGVFDDAKTQLFTPVTKLYMKKYLVTEKITDADKRLRMLNIVGGFEGLDFSESSFLSDNDENIDLVVRYSIKLPLPILFTDGLEFVQRARVKAWMGGDETGGVLDGTNAGVTDDIWSLSNFRRGMKIRRLFGANLPDSFPVIASFDGGRAVMIKSMDLTAASYQTGGNAEKTLKGYIKDLAEFKGQDRPWGRDGLVIRGEDITVRELLLVIPKNKLSEANESMLAEIASFADSKGIRLKVERYGMKVTEEADDGADDGGGDEDGTAEGE